MHGYSFEDGLRLVKLRGESMQAAADATPSAMVSVIGLDSGKVLPGSQAMLHSCDLPQCWQPWMLHDCCKLQFLLSIPDCRG